MICLSCPSGQTPLPAAPPALSDFPYFAKVIDELEDLGQGPMVPVPPHQPDIGNLGFQCLVLLAVEAHEYKCGEVSRPRHLLHCHHFLVTIPQLCSYKFFLGKHNTRGWVGEAWVSFGSPNEVGPC